MEQFNVVPKRLHRVSRKKTILVIAANLVALSLLVSACGDATQQEGTTASTGAAKPTVLVTTGIWSDIVSNVLCSGDINVATLIPVGGDPHNYEPSLQDRERMENAALVVANGLGLEERLEDTLMAVEQNGTPVFRAAEHASTVLTGDDSGGHGHDAEEETGEVEEAGHDHDAEAEVEEAGRDHDAEEDVEYGHDHEAEVDVEEAGHDETEVDVEEAGHDHETEVGGHDNEESEGEVDDHGQEVAAEEAGHDHEAGDPHVWFDPQRVKETLSELQQLAVEHVGLGSDAVASCVNDYSSELDSLDAEISALLGQIPESNRKLITNHDALAYFADRYEFEIVGTVIPATSTMAETNPAQLAELAEVIEHEGVPAIFAENLHNSDDAEVLAARVGAVEVVTLYTGSLGPPGSGAEDYLGFMRTNAQLITDALT